MKTLFNFYKKMNSASTLRLVLAIAMLIAPVFFASSVSAQMSPPGNALSFDNTDDWVDLGDTIENFSAITCEAWIYRTNAVPPGLFDTIVSKFDISSFAINAGEKLIFRVGMSTDVDSVSSIPLNEWIHVAGTWDGSTVSLYINGQLDATATRTPTVGGNANTRGIGDRPGANRNFAGMIDEVRIWSTARTQADIKKYMNTTLVGTESGLISYYQFDETLGTNLPDQAGTNHGTLTNGPTWTASGAVLSAPGNALDFDGTNDYADLGTSSDFNLDDFTISAWIRTTYTGQGVIFSKSDETYSAGFPKLCRLLLDNGTPSIGLREINGSTWYQANGTSAVNDGNWHHIAGVRQGTELRIYVDGVLENTATGLPTTAFSFDPSVNSYIGRFWNGVSGYEAYFNGEIDEVRIWNDYRTLTEIQDNMYKTLDPASEGNLVSYYRFNQDGITLTDYTTSNNHGTLTNMSPSTDWVSSGITHPAPGNALDFDGTDDYADLGTSSDFNLDDFAISAWIRTTYTGQGVIFSKSDETYGAGLPKLFQLIIDNGTARLGMREINSSAWYQAAGTSAVNDGNWHHIAGVRQGTELRIYVDGVLENTATGVPTTGFSFDPSANSYIGRYWNGSGGYDAYFNGKIDEVRIWDNARTQSEIQENMHKTLTGGEANLVAYYPFDEWDGVILPDHTANDNHGILANMEPLSDWTCSDAFNTWTGATDTDWSRGSNWTRNSVPTSADNVGIPSGGNQPIISSPGLCNNLVINTGATLTVSGNNSLTVSGNFISRGTFTAGTGTVILDGGNQSVYGSTSFNNLTKNVTSAATLIFENGSAQTITGTLDMQGASSNLLSLRSDSDGTQWSIDPQGTRTLSYADVKDSNNANAAAINIAGTNSVGSGNNTNWNIYDPVIAQGTSVTASMDEDGSPTAWTAPTVTASDGDGDTITWTVSTPATNGTATVSGTGASPPTFTYVPDADYNGADSFVVQAADAFGSDTVTVSVTVNAVNDTPSFTKGADQTVSEDAGAQAVNGWATSVSKGPANESAQILTFNVSNDNNLLFSSQPSVDASGNLAYTPGSDASGSATVTVSLSDNGGGADTSGNQTFVITVNPVNDTPSFTKGADHTVNEDAGAQTVTGWATSVSKGPADESGQTLTFNVSNDNSSLFSSQPAIDTSGNLTYTPAANANGRATVTVSLSDNGGGAGTSADQTFAITVNPVDDAPTVANVIPDITVNEDSANTATDLGSVFTDIDNDVSAIAKSVLSNSNPGLVSASISSNTLTLSYQANQNGTALITVRGTSGSQFADDTLTITVSPGDDAPVVANAIADVTVNEDSADTVINLGSVFTDIDNDVSAIAKSVLSNSNPGLMSANVSGNTLTLDYQPDMNGTASVTIRGTSNGQIADDVFTVTVNPGDDAPVVANAIADVTVNEDSADTVIGLGSVFTDIDNDVSVIAKSVLSNSNPGLVSATVSGNTLTLDYQPDMNGVASVTIRGTSNGRIADDTFTVTVNAMDDALTVANPIADVMADEDAANTEIDLGAVFTDIDNDDSAIAKSLLSNSNPSLVSATLTGNMLTLDFQENQNGTALITIRGTSNSKTADNTFTVTVNASDDAPVVANPLPDVTVDEDSADTAADLGTLFTDIDNDDAAIVKSVQSNSNESLVSAAVTGNTLTLDYLTNQSGSAVITVLGTSNGQTVTDEFIVTVNDVNSYVSGKITYYSNGNPVPGVTLTMEGAGSSRTALSDETGRYIISSIPSGYDYVLTLSKEGDPGPGTLSSLDASRIARYAIGMYEMTESEILAADVNGNGYVSGVDASRVARYKAGLITQMNDQGRHWTFSPASEEYSPLDSDIENRDFAGMRLGDVSGTWQAEPLQRSGQRNQTSETSEVSVVADQGAELSVPVILETEIPIEGTDITAVFDEKVLDATGVTLADGILESMDYGLAANTNADSRVTAAIFAKSYLVTDAGTVAVLKFRVVGEDDDTTLLTFSEFACNRIPVSEPAPDHRSQTANIVSGGFYVNGKVSRRLKITVSGDQAVTAEKDKDIMIYDLDRDGRVGLQDAVRALREGCLETAIKALQCVTGK